MFLLSRYGSVRLHRDLSKNSYGYRQNSFISQIPVNLARANDLSLLASK